MPRKTTQQEIIAKFQESHGSTYDYTLVEYRNSNTKVKVICSVHGIFEVQPGHHVNGVGCRECYFDSQKTSKAEFVERSQIHFGNRYDYTLFDELPSFGEKVQIYCREHEAIFLQEPRNHMRGHVGCSQCKSLKLAGPISERGNMKNASEVKEAFVRRAESVHGKNYDYSQFNYLTSNIKGVIICPKHGEFWQTPSNHLKGTKCPECAKDILKTNTFKKKCKELGIDYWRALKRREAGLSEEKIFKEGYVRNTREVNEINVYGVTYPNLREAIRALKPSASSHTISRWIESGMPPEEAFERVANPGYANGIIYRITNKSTGKEYVGLTIQTLERRWNYHIQQAMAGYINGTDSLHAAIREFGPDDFVVLQIDSGTTKNDLEKKERYWIKKLGTLSPQGYNISSGGVSGGSNKKAVEIDGVRFESVGIAAQHISETREISVDAAKARLRSGRINIKSPAKTGMSLIKTPAYKAWSRIFHGVLNAKSKDFISGLNVYAPWRDFQTFLNDVGQPPEAGMAFARLNKSDGFYPGNCAWLSKSEASRINAANMKNQGTLVGRKGVTGREPKPSNEEFNQAEAPA
jgi:group I intron endonuclease